MSTEEKNVCLVNLTEQTELYAEMADYMEKVGADAQELSVEERNLLSGACKYAVGRRRAACKIITSVEGKEKSKGNEDLYQYIAEFTDGDKTKEAAEHARKPYAEAQTIAEQDLVVTHSLQLGLALNYSVLVEMHKELRVWLSG